MARARNIKPGFFINEDLADLPFEARLLFIGLWTLADREGRLEDRPRRIKGNLFPYDSFDVDPMLNRLQSDDFLLRYEINGTRFIQIKNFVKHQDPHYKEKASDIPPPIGNENIIKATGITRSKRVEILERDNYECQSCGSKENLCIDHIIPASRGGDSGSDNLQVLCMSCNTRKGNKLDGEIKGFKKGIHNSSSLLTRLDLGLNLIQRNDASPSDSLIPDSLIPDSLIPDSLIPDSKVAIAPSDLPIEPKEAIAELEKTKPFEFVLPDWVSKEQWDLWLKTRKGKKMIPEQKQAQVDKLREWKEAGLDYSSALSDAARAGWQGLFEPKQKSQLNRAGSEAGFDKNLRENYDTKNGNNEARTGTGRKLCLVDEAQLAIDRIEARELREQQDRARVVN